MISISLWASALRPPHGAELLVSLCLTPLLPSLQLPVGSRQAWLWVSLCPRGARQPDENEAAAPSYLDLRVTLSLCILRSSSTYLINKLRRLEVASVKVSF